jgi:hypothetical protein
VQSWARAYLFLEQHSDRHARSEATKQPRGG